MDTDFHFFGTATAAISSGFSGKEATLIANAAEYVDFFNSDYWCFWSIKDAEHKELIKIDYPHLSSQTIDWKMIGDYDEHLWNAFHFPPGNRAHDDSSLKQYLGDNSEPDWVNSFKSLLQVRETNLSPSNKPLLCRPYSPFALHMALDTIAKFREIKAATDPDNLSRLLKQYLGDIPHVASNDSEQLALVFLGIRMHVLSDTWAHQDFSGIASKEINGAGTFNHVYASKCHPQILESTSWKGTLWALAEDTDCAAAPNIPGDAACRGHGQMGHFPDYSWLTFIYPAAWLMSGGYLIRNNPQQYREAWFWLRTVMASCLSDKCAQPDVTGILQIPQEISDCIETEHSLDDTSLFAVSESEQVWRKTALAKNLHEYHRWNQHQGQFSDSHRKELGVIDGLPTTRYGTVNIAENSTLHLMELASAIHYTWCIEWAQAHPEFQWQPQPKG